MAVAGAAGDPGAMDETTVERPAVRRLERSQSDRMLAGVCGGLARYFDIHPAFYRVGFVVLTLIGGAGILIYIAAALVIPDEGEEDSIASAALRERRDRPLPLIGLALIALAGLVLLSRVSIWPNGDAAWILLLIAGGIVLSFRTARGPRRHRVKRRPRPHAPARGAGRAASRSGLGTAVGVVLAFVLVAAAIFAAVFHVHLGNGIGDQTYDVRALTELHPEYKLGIGDLRVDLREVRLPVGVTHLRTRVDVGRVDVVVPHDAALRVHSEADFGTVAVLGQSADGRKVDRSVDEAGKRLLDLDAHVGVGSVHIERAVR